MHFSFWRARLPATLATALLAVIMMAASPPMARALTPANTDATIELVVVQNQRIAVTVNATAIAELKKLDNVSFRVAWVHDDVGWATMPSARNDHDRFKVDAMANTNPAATKINASPQPGARVQPNNNDVRGSIYLVVNTAQPASNPAAPRLNTANSRTPTLRGGVILASNAGGGWVETALALLHGRYEGRVS